MRKSLTFLILSTCLLSCHQLSDNKNDLRKNSVSGLWKLHIMEIKDSTDHWQEWRNGMGGYLLYDQDQHMALHLFSKNYASYQPDFPNFSDTIPLTALKHLTNNYNYMGIYTLDTTNQIVSHQRLSHSNPKDWGITVQRRFHFSGDTLIIQPVESENARLRLKWLRAD